MADRRTSVFVLLFLIYFIFNNDAGAQLRSRELRSAIDDAAAETRRLLAYVGNATYGGIETAFQQDVVNGTAPSLGGFEFAERYSWSSLPKVQAQAREQLMYALGEPGTKRLDGFQSAAVPPALYGNVTGDVRGRWVRSRLSSDADIPRTNFSEFTVEGPFGFVQHSRFDANFTGRSGSVFVGLHQKPVPAKLESASHFQGNITPISADVRLTEDHTEQEEMLHLRGVYFPQFGQAVLTTTTPKFAGIMALPLFANSQYTFNLSRDLVNQTITRFLDGRDSWSSDAVNPWLGNTENPERQPHANPKCELILYMQQMPPAQEKPGKPSLSLFDKELRFPTGAPIGDPPKMQFSMLAFSPDCGYILESEGPPDHAPPAQHLTGHKNEADQARGRHHILVYGVVVALQVLSLLRQMKDASTPSTRSRISFYTIAMMTFGDSIASVYFIFVGSMIEHEWIAVLSTAFLSFNGMLLFGMRFMHDLWAVYAPERRRQMQEAADEMRRQRESAIAAARERQQTRYAQPNTNNAATTQPLAPPIVPPPAGTTLASPPAGTTLASPPAGTTTAPPTAVTNPTESLSIDPAPPSTIRTTDADTLPLPSTAPRAVDFGSMPLFMPADQAGLLPTNPQAADNAAVQVPTFSSIYFRFFALHIIVLFISASATTYPGTLRRAYFRFLIFAYLSFWIPQIHRNALRNCRRALKWEYVLTQSILRLVPIAYFFGWDDNVLFVPAQPITLAIFAAWVWMQIVVLASQEIIGPRWFVKKDWLPAAWDYHPILRSDLEGSTLPLGLADSVSLPTSPSVERSSPLSPTDQPKGSVAKDTKSNGKKVFDCAICMQDLEVPVVDAGEASEVNAAVSGSLMLARRTYMVTPCRHIFHSSCLQGWMKYRLQCPICREGLPPS